MKRPTFELIASSAHYICTHTPTAWQGLALKAPKPCLLGVRPDPPHITMEMALHCVCVCAWEGGFMHLRGPGTSTVQVTRVGLIEEEKQEHKL